MTKRRFLFAMLFVLAMNSQALSQTHTYEVVEESFTASKAYDNPYMDVDLWVDLSGTAGQQIRIPAFWDGGQTFRVRMMGTAPGTWSWLTGKRTGDSGLDGKRGSFNVRAWTEQRIPIDAGLFVPLPGGVRWSTRTAHPSFSRVTPAILP